MLDKEIDETVFNDDQVVVEMTDEDGNVYYYVEEMIIPVGDERFALLVSVEPTECECDDDDCDCGEDFDSIIAKIIVDENGEDLYVEPTDEEFEAVEKAYNKLMDDLS